MRFSILVASAAISCAAGCIDDSTSSPNITSKQDADPQTSPTDIAEAPHPTDVKSGPNPESELNTDSEPVVKNATHPDPASNSDELTAEQSSSVRNTSPHEHGQGRGRGPGRGMRGGFRPDMTTIHTMFAGRDKIERIVTPQPTGAEAVTESEDTEIAGLIQEHVPAMESRIHEQNPLPPMTFHPVFLELAKNADQYTLNYEDTEKGVKVTYEADDPFVIMLVQEHAKLVSRFIRNGMQEIHKPYQFPEVDETPKADEGGKTEEAT